MTDPMTDPWAETALPCGAELEPLLEQIADGRADQPTAHQRGCRYCSAALDEGDRLWGPVRELAAEVVEVPERVVASILRRVQRLINTGWVALSRTARGLTEVSGWVVAAIAEVAADDTPGVHRVGTSLGRVAEFLRLADPRGTDERTASGGAAYEVGERQASIDIDLVTRYGASIPSTADEIRRRVTDDVRRLTGLDVVEVNLDVRDVHVEHPPAH